MNPPQDAARPAPCRQPARGRDRDLGAGGRRPQPRPGGQPPGRRRGPDRGPRRRSRCPPGSPVNIEIERRRGGHRQAARRRAHQRQGPRDERADQRPVPGAGGRGEGDPPRPVHRHVVAAMALRRDGVPRRVPQGAPRRAGCARRPDDAVRDHAPGHRRGDRRPGQGGARLLEQGLHRQGQLGPGGQAVPGRGRAAARRARREDGDARLVAGAAVRPAEGRRGVDRRHGRRAAAALRHARRRHGRHARPVRRQARSHRGASESGRGTGRADRASAA